MIGRSPTWRRRCAFNSQTGAWRRCRSRRWRTTKRTRHHSRWLRSARCQRGATRRCPHLWPRRGRTQVGERLLRRVSSPPSVAWTSTVKSMMPNPGAKVSSFSPSDQSSSQTFRPASCQPPRTAVRQASVERFNLSALGWCEEWRLSQNQLENFGLAFDVGIDVHCGICSKRDLDCGVSISKVIAPAQDVTDGQVVADIETPCFADVDVATRIVVRRVEGLTANESEVPPMSIADAL